MRGSTACLNNKVFFLCFLLLPIKILLLCAALISLRLGNLSLSFFISDGAAMLRSPVCVYTGVLSFSVLDDFQHIRVMPFHI